MKSFIKVVILFWSIFSFAQNSTSKLDTVRRQGYLIIKTNESNRLTDIPYFYVFIPSDKTTSDLKKSYDNYNRPVNSAMYMLRPYIADNDDIFELNYTFKKHVSEFKIDFHSSIARNSFFEKSNKLFCFVEEESPKQVYKIVYIDGVWLKANIPDKARRMIGMWGTSLEKKCE